MKSLVASVVAAFGLTCPCQTQGPADPATALAEARLALGGDTTLSAVTSFTINGSSGIEADISRYPASDLSFEIRCVLPDKFVRITHQFAGGDKPGAPSGDVAEWVGFNGADPIRDTLTRIPGGVADDLDPPSLRTATEKAAFRAQQVLNGKRLFAAFTLPLFASSFASFPLQFSTVTSARTGERTLVALNGTDATGQPWRLFLDANTHLPALLMWKAKPLLRFIGGPTTERLTRVAGPSNAPELVQWRLELSDYAKSNGVNWPRKLKMSFPHEYPHVEDMKIARFAINPQIDPKTFAPTK